jgi:hypothetical protein
MHVLSITWKNNSLTEQQQSLGEPSQHEGTPGLPEPGSPFVLRNLKAVQDTEVRATILRTNKDSHIYCCRL